MPTPPKKMRVRDSIRTLKSGKHSRQLPIFARAEVSARVSKQSSKKVYKKIFKKKKKIFHSIVTFAFEQTTRLLTLEYVKIEWRCLTIVRFSENQTKHMSTNASSQQSSPVVEGDDHACSGRFQLMTI